MAQKQQSQSIRRGRTPLLITIIAICIAALILGGGAVVYAAVTPPDTEIAAAGINILITIIGNDIVVEFHDGKNIDRLQAVRLIIEGYDLPPGVSVISFSGQDKVTYPGYLAGVRGTHRISVSGQFDDGREMLIHQQEFRFT